MEFLENAWGVLVPRSSTMCPPICVLAQLIKHANHLGAHHRGLSILTQTNCFSPHTCHVSCLHSPRPTWYPTWNSISDTWKRWNKEPSTVCGVCKPQLFYLDIHCEGWLMGEWPWGEGLCATFRARGNVRGKGDEWVWWLCSFGRHTFLPFSMLVVHWWRRFSRKMAPTMEVKLYPLVVADVVYLIDIVFIHSRHRYTCSLSPNTMHSWTSQTCRGAPILLWGQG